MKNSSNYQIIKWQNFYGWCKKQTGPVNLTQTKNDYNQIGCPMVQYGRYLGLKFDFCSLSAWHNENGAVIARLDQPIFRMTCDALTFEEL